MVTLYRSLISFFPSSIIICITNFNNNKRKQIHIQSLYKHAFLDRREPVPSLLYNLQTTWVWRKRKRKHFSASVQILTRKDSLEDLSVLTPHRNQDQTKEIRSRIEMITCRNEGSAYCERNKSEKNAISKPTPHVHASRTSTNVFLNTKLCRHWIIIMMFQGESSEIPSTTLHTKIFKYVHILHNKLAWVRSYVTRNITKECLHKYVKWETSNDE